MFNVYFSAEIPRGPVQEFQFSDDEEEEEPVPKKLSKKKSSKKQAAASSSSESDDDSDDGHVTMANMEAKSRALDEAALREAELDAEELQALAQEEELDDDMDDQSEAGEGDVDEEPFTLPTSEEREKEKATGGTDLHTLQRRMQICLRVLAKFTKRREPGR